MTMRTSINLESIRQHINTSAKEAELLSPEVEYAMVFQRIFKISKE
jgi:hypothetical protein